MNTLQEHSGSYHPPPPHRTCSVQIKKWKSQEFSVTFCKTITDSLVNLSLLFFFVDILYLYFFPHFLRQLLNWFSHVLPSDLAEQFAILFRVGWCCILATRGVQPCNFTISTCSQSCPHLTNPFLLWLQGTAQQPMVPPAP